MDNKNCVSVIVASYNSSDTIRDTLESIYRQTYQCLELIVTDDASSDETVSIADAWIKEHSGRFVNCIINVNKENKGVPGNLNEGIKKSQGYYIKTIAADDILLPECIEKNFNFCEKNQCENVYSRMQCFCEKNGEINILPEFDVEREFFEKSVPEQYKDLLQWNRVFAPTFFSTKNLLENQGWYDTTFRYMEDYPMVLKLSQSGIHINFMNDYTVQYRINEKSLSNVITTKIINVNYYKTTRKFFFKKRFIALIKAGFYKRVLIEVKEIFFKDLILLFGNNANSKIVQKLNRLRTSRYRD